MQKTVDKIKELVSQLNKASYAYYGEDNPIMSDKQYDDLYDELERLEKQTGFILAGSPTQKVQGYLLENLKAVKHSKPMLSAAKTKDIQEIEKFISGQDTYASYKLDGLTLVVRYKNGKFVQGITRGNGLVGEDVTEQCRCIKNLPMSISYTDDLEIRGECVISWENFAKINETLNCRYSHPRNLSAGTLRNLNLNAIKKRELSFVAFECVSPLTNELYNDSKWDRLIYLDRLGFETVERLWLTEHTDLLSSDDFFTKVSDYKYPVDGIVFELDDFEYSQSLGSTKHHEKCRMAFKWADELHETVLKDIEWNTTRTGVINPVAVFEPVDLDGAITTRATLHNISYIENLELGLGDTIQVYRSNMVIPKIHNNLTRSNTYKIPSKCPCCGSNAEVCNENGSKTLHCYNANCRAKKINELVHFCSRDAMNIEGLSISTLEKIMTVVDIQNFPDLYKLKEYRKDLIKLDGLGEKSIDKILQQIEKSRKITLARFLYALGIASIGKSASKSIAEFCNNDICDFYKFIVSEPYKFLEIKDFGNSMYRCLLDWWNENCLWLTMFTPEFTFVADTTTTNDKLKGKTFVVTGSLKIFKNRNELISEIEKFGGKVTSSISEKTNYLINNDVNSTSSKNKKAKTLGIPIINEEILVEMLKDL